MNITLNGNEKSIDKDQLTVTELLAHENVDMPEMVSVEYNGDILDRDQFATTNVKEGDKVEFLYFMGGGA
tara:strand:+ start:388 stop:597 length:210 start_codon:yes stop_codon:yes gene_type:complete